MPNLAFEPTKLIAIATLELNSLAMQQTTSIVPTITSTYKPILEQPTVAVHYIAMQLNQVFLLYQRQELTQTFLMSMPIFLPIYIFLEK